MFKIIYTFVSISILTSCTTERAKEIPISSKQDSTILINNSDPDNSTKKSIHKTNESPVSIKVSYAGKVGNYPIQMEINIDRAKNMIQGTYRYTNTKEEHTIYLEGKIINNRIDLKEEVYKNENRQQTGAFSLQFDDLHRVSGTWENPEKTKTLDVVLTSIENFEYEPLAYTFNTNLQKVELEKYPDSDEKTEFTQLQSVEIYHQNELVQTIADMNITIFEDSNTIELEDLNFDGYYDLKIIESYPFVSKPDYGILFFIYDPATKQFVPNPNLNELRYIVCNSFTKTFTYITADGSGNESYTDYKWKGNTFKKIKRTEYFEDNREPVISEYPYE